MKRTTFCCSSWVANGSQLFEVSDLETAKQKLSRVTFEFFNLVTVTLLRNRKLNLNNLKYNDQAIRTFKIRLQLVWRNSKPNSRNDIRNATQDIFKKTVPPLRKYSFFSQNRVGGPFSPKNTYISNPKRVFSCFFELFGVLKNATFRKSTFLRSVVSTDRLSESVGEKVHLRQRRKMNATQAAREAYKVVSWGELLFCRRLWFAQPRSVWASRLARSHQRDISFIKWFFFRRLENKKRKKDLFNEWRTNFFC